MKRAALSSAGLSPSLPRLSFWAYRWCEHANVLPRMDVWCPHTSPERSNRSSEGRRCHPPAGTSSPGWGNKKQNITVNTAPSAGKLEDAVWDTHFVRVLRYGSTISTKSLGALCPYPGMSTRVKAPPTRKKFIFFVWPWGTETHNKNLSEYFYFFFSHFFFCRTFVTDHS